MKLLVWRSEATGRWRITVGDDLKSPPGADPAGYDSWRDAYTAACLIIASEPA